MAQDIEKIKERISKMLATASCSASTPAEKSTAMAMASALMQRYNLERDDIEGKDKGEFSEVIVKTLLVRMMPWESMLASFVSMYVVKGSWAVLQRETGAVGAVNQATINFVGLGADPQIAAATFYHLRELLVNECSEIYGPTVRGPGRSFAVGFVTGLVTVAKENEKKNRLNAEAGTALMRTDMLKTQSKNWYLAQKDAKVRKTNSKIGGVSRDPYNAGYAAGRSANVEQRNPISGRLT